MFQVNRGKGKILLPNNTGESRVFSRKTRKTKKAAIEGGSRIHWSYGMRIPIYALNEPTLTESIELW